MKKYFVRRIEDKLQLLSTNFDIGDTVYWHRPRQDEPRIVGSFLNNKPGSWFPKGVTKQLGSLKGIHSYSWGKIIGQISSEATWVKDGDEFDEDSLQILCVYTDDGDISIPFTELKYVRKDAPYYVQIKGPCGHFH